MQIFSLSDKGKLTKVKKANFAEKRVFIIDDYKTLYLWFGVKVSKKRKDLALKKINNIKDKRENPPLIQILNQNKEYGAFLAMMEILKKGLPQNEVIDRRPELELEIEDTVELIEAGLDPDLEAEINMTAFNLSQEKKTYEDLCEILAEIQLSLLNPKGKPSQEQIKKKTKEIYESSSTYEELCWLIAELSKLKENKALS